MSYPPHVSGACMDMYSVSHFIVLPASDLVSCVNLEDEKYIQKLDMPKRSSCEENKLTKGDLKIKMFFSSFLV